MRETRVRFRTALSCPVLVVADYQRLEWNTIETMIIKWNSVFQGFNLVS